jgi:hypothetical protein
VRELLTEPDDDAPWRIDGWQQCDQRVMLAAQFKAGKTTLVHNAVRSLVDGTPFLGAYSVRPLDGALAILDFEMSKNQLRRWYRSQGIDNDDRLVLIAMRGSACSFDIRDSDVRHYWAQLLRDRNVVYLVLDCLRPVLDALGLDEKSDTGKFFVPFNALLDEAGIREAIVVHHMGHENERARGDSRLRDWPDVEWRLIRKDEAPHSPRFITAYGRDIDVPETQLGYDTITRHLTVVGGSRREAEAEEALPFVLDTLRRAQEALSGRQVVQRMKDGDYSAKVIYAALKCGVDTGRIRWRHGPKGARLHEVAEASLPM